MRIRFTNKTKPLKLLVWIFGLIGCFSAVLSGAEKTTLNMNDPFIQPPGTSQARNEYLDELYLFRQKGREIIQRGAAALLEDLRISEGSSAEAGGRSFCCVMVMLFDTEIYDPAVGRWKMEAYLQKKWREVGPVDRIILWTGYPRLGADERNQFDFWRDQPGGSAGIREIVNTCHRHGVRVILPYNPWDTGTRRAGKSDYEMLAELVEQTGEDKSDYELLADLVGATGTDGVFLDTLSAGSIELRQKLNRVHPGLEVITEGNPSLEQMPLINGFWGQWLTEGPRPGILKLRWIDPDRQQYLIRRWDRNRGEEVETAFFNGSGIVVWENVFGMENPWSSRDSRMWKKANLILHHFSDLFTRGRWEPFVPVTQADLYANGWADEDSLLYVLINKGAAIRDKALIQIPHREGDVYFDLWNGKRMEPRMEKDTAILENSIDSVGCMLAIGKSAVTPAFLSFLKQLQDADASEYDSGEALSLPAVRTAVEHRTKPASAENPPEGMIYVPGGEFTLKIRHTRRECGCYLDQAVETPGDFGYGLEFGAVYPQVIHHEIEHTIGPVQVRPFFIDAAEVTNRQYREFLDASGYRPKQAENFLKHWPAGKMPAEPADHPVVYVDPEDARAYAAWCHKRLPTEAEWQLAAQGTDGRKWPWGMEFDPKKCNGGGGGTMPVKSCPEGRSPWGCYDLCGNVWEWTEPTYTDGHTRFAMIRGGSFYKAKGSIWYMDGGPQPCDCHAKFVLAGPGLDRCSTVGFRCVRDAE